jgi:thiaminase
MQQIPNTHQWTNWEDMFSKRFVRQLGEGTVELSETVFLFAVHAEVL